MYAATLWRQSLQLASGANVHTSVPKSLRHLPHDKGFKFAAHVSCALNLSNSSSTAACASDSWFNRNSNFGTWRAFNALPIDTRIFDSLHEC